ncbi:MAG TPA: TIGR02588 family protein [Woeseiaceae bacterium]|nr:TIGR02588 family protein [Woeseiaceae bacterium]
MPEKKHKRRRAGHGPPISQYLVASLGLVIVLATMGYLAYAALFGDGTPPSLQLSVSRIEQTGSGYRVLFTAKNSGAETAAAVHLEARLLRDGGPVEEARATLDYVPGHSETKGGFAFENDPRQGELRLEVSGYELP